METDFLMVCCELPIPAVLWLGDGFHGTYLGGMAFLAQLIGFSGISVALEDRMTVLRFLILCLLKGNLHMMHRCNNHGVCEAFIVTGYLQ